MKANDFLRCCDGSSTCSTAPYLTSELVLEEAFVVRCWPLHALSKFRLVVRNFGSTSSSNVESSVLRPSLALGRFVFSWPLLLRRSTILTWEFV